MTKKIFILLIAFGFFMNSNAIFACNSHSNKEILANHRMEDGCNKESTSKTSKHNCCDKKSTNEKDTGCKGKCGHGNCTVSVVQFALMQPFINDYSVEKYFPLSNKINFSYLKTNISLGFYSLWLIHKIG